MSRLPYLLRYAACRDWPPAGDLPLGEREQRELARVSDAGRRRQWLAARALAKEMLCEAGCSATPSEIEILSRDSAGRGVRPLVLLRDRGEVCQRSLTLAHTDRGVLVALATDDATQLGADLVDDVPRGAGFRRLWFTTRENEWVDAAPDRREERLAVLWGIKEAVYKATHAGESWSPRDTAVTPVGAGFRCAWQGQPLDQLQIQVSELDGQIAVVVAQPRSTAAAPRPIAPLGLAHAPLRTLHARNLCS